MTYRITAMQSADVRRAATYLSGAHGEAAVAALTAEWTWRLFENPAGADRERGHLVIDDHGDVRGIHLAIPQAFVAGTRTLLGLCSSAFYVDEAVRLQGFLLYRRFLAQPADFHFATTSNQVAGENARRNGSAPVVSASTEVVIPLHPSRVADAYFAGRAIRPLPVLAALAGAPVLRALRRRYAGSVSLSGGTAAPDWDVLATLAERHRGDAITAVRSAPTLAWRYGGPDAAERRLWRARDAQGREGWIAAGRLGRVFGPHLRSWMVLDYVWPQEADPTSLLVAAARALADEADLLAVRGRRLTGLRRHAVVGVRREFRHPPAWVKASFSADTLDLVPADGDTAP